MQGPLAFTSENEKANFTLKWADLHVTLRGLIGGMKRIAIDVEQPDLSLSDGGGGSAEHAELHVGPAIGRPVDDLADAVELLVSGASVPALDAATGDAVPLDSEIKGVITHVLDDLPDFGPGTVDRWRQNGGQVEVSRAVLNKGDLKVEATGSVGLDEQHRPAGRLQAGLSGFGPLAETTRHPDAGRRGRGIDGEAVERLASGRAGRCRRRRQRRPSDHPGGRDAVGRAGSNGCSPPALVLKRGCRPCLTRQAPVAQRTDGSGRVAAVLPRLLCVLSLLACLVAGPATAQVPTKAAGDLDAAKGTIDMIEARLTRSDMSDAVLQQLRAQVDPVAVQMNAVVSELGPRIDAAKARLAQLGPKPDPKTGSAEAPDIAKERDAQQSLFNDLDATAKRAKVMAVQAGQISDTILARRRALFAHDLFTRSTSLLAPALWASVGAEMRASCRRWRTWWTIGSRRRCSGSRSGKGRSCAC